MILSLTLSEAFVTSDLSHLQIRYRNLEEGFIISSRKPSKRSQRVFSNIASHPIGARDRIATPVRRDAMRCDDFRSDPIASLSHRPEYSLT